MKKTVIYSITIAFLWGLTVIISCNKDNVTDNCYDEQLYQANKNNNCPQDCPGVVGYDGKTYCNECEAFKQGIKTKE